MSFREIAVVIRSLIALTFLVAVPPVGAQDPVVSWAIEVPDPVTVSASSAGVAILGEIRDSVEIGGSMIEGPAWGIVAATISGSGVLERVLTIDTGPIPTRRDLAVDATGAIWVGSSFGDTLRLGDQKIVSPSTRDMFLAKFSPPLELERLVVPDSSYEISAGNPGVRRVLATDSLVYLLGWSGPFTRSIYSGAFLAQFSLRGDLRWSVRVRDAHEDNGVAHDLAVMPDGGTVFTAELPTRNVVIADTTVVLEHIPEGQRANRSRLITRFDANGKLVWYRVLRGVYDIAKLAATGDGGFLLAATHHDSLIFEDTAMLAPADEGGEAFVARFDEAGSLSWALALPAEFFDGSRGSSNVMGVAGDSTGRFHVLVQYVAPGGTLEDGTVHLIGLNSVGDELYRKTLPGHGFTVGNAGTLATDGAGDLYAWTGDYLVKVQLSGLPNRREPNPRQPRGALEAFPNPAGDHFTMRYSLAAPSVVRMSVVDVLGREVLIVEDAHRSAGTHERLVNASRVPPGVYFVRLAVGDTSRTSRLVVIR